MNIINKVKFGNAKPPLIYPTQFTPLHFKYFFSQFFPNFFPNLPNYPKFQSVNFPTFYNELRYEDYEFSQN